MRLSADTVSVSTSPTYEPVSFDEAVNHLRVDNENDEYGIIVRLIEAARVSCEGVVGKRFITQTMQGGLPSWPGDGVIRLPYIPVQSVTSITYVDTAGDSATVSSAVYGVDTKLGLIYLNYNQSWPTATLRPFDPITVTWVAGYGDDKEDVPATYKSAMLLMIGHLYENREAVIVGAGYTATELPMAVSSLLMQDRNY